MVQINFGQREVSCKVVFYGPGMSGKTTNLEIIHKKAPKDAVGEMVSIATETDRTLYFDFLPLDLGQVAGMRTKFQLYTVPGQIYYNATRKLVLQGVDGVIFVADSNPEKMAENLESLQNLRDNLAEMGLKLEDLPLVLQYNKRDLPNALSVADMDAQMNPLKVPTHEACARDGRGVFATLKEISRLVIEKLNREHAPAANRRRTANTLPPAGGGPTGTPPAPLPVVNTAPAAMPPQFASQATPIQAQPTVASATPPAPVAALPPRPLPPPPPPRPSQTAPTPPQPRAALPPTSRPSAPPTRSAPAPVAADDIAARDRHLAKAKPPALQQARTSAPEQHTDPTLRRYQDTRGNGGALKGALITLGVIIGLVALFILLVRFVPAVRAIMPTPIQQLVLDGSSPAAPAQPAPAQPVPAQPAKP